MRLGLVMLVLGGCSFHVPSLTDGVGSPWGTPGPGPTTGATSDLSTTAPDFGGADLQSPVPGFPSHVDYHYTIDSNTDWAVDGDTTIDTSALTITPAAPAGVLLALDGDYVVLAVHSLTVGTAGSTTRLSAVGSRPLIIVAGTTIAVNGLLDVGGHRGIPGAGGAASMKGAGSGAPGTLGAAYGPGGAGG
jgi:hypothetical protein